MANFAQLDNNNIVTQIIVIDNDDILDTNGNESESIGQLLILDLFDSDPNFDKSLVWKQTSYNYNIRKNYATIGGSYDETKDAFIDLQPYPSWTLDATSCRWKSPVDRPSQIGKERYVWDEDNNQWIRLEEGEV